jgi:hypothetical protein
VLVAGSNERHPDFDVFSYLGPLAVKMLVDAGVGAYGRSILLLCDNPFLPFLRRGLEAAGACVEVAASPADARRDQIDAVVVSMTPRATPVLDDSDARVIAGRWPNAVVGQFFGDIDREALAAADLGVWPPAAPPAGHMGVLLSDLGPEPIVRLQASGLKSAEVMRRRHTHSSGGGEEYLEILVDKDGVKCPAYC